MFTYDPISGHIFKYTTAGYSTPRRHHVAHQWKATNASQRRLPGLWQALDMHPSSRASE
jgi:hypothetical protein